MEISLSGYNRGYENDFSTVMEILLKLPPLHVMTEAETQALSTDQCAPKSGHLNPLTGQAQDMKHDPTLQTGRYQDTHTTSHSLSSAPASVKGRMHSTQIIQRTWSGIWMGKRTNKGICAEVYRWGSRRGQRFNLGLHTMVFQSEIYTIKACVMQNTEKG